MAKKRTSTKKTITQPPSRMWFKSKNYGWGWYPATWEGWVVLGTYIVVCIVNFMRIYMQNPSLDVAMVAFIPETSILTFILFYICVKKGEKPHWRWGGR